MEIQPPPYAFVSDQDDTGVRKQNGLRAPVSLKYWRVVVQDRNKRCVLHMIPIAAGETPSSLLKKVQARMPKAEVLKSWWLKKALSVHMNIAHVAVINSVAIHHDAEANYGPEVFVKESQLDGALTHALNTSKRLANESDFITTRSMFFEAEATGNRSIISTIQNRTALLVNRGLDQRKLIMLFTVTIVVSILMGIVSGCATHSSSTGISVSAGAVGILSSVQAMNLWMSIRESWLG